MPKVYSWRDRASHRVDAETAVAELTRIKKANGGVLTPRAVVEASRNKKAVLHGEFEWDDAVAGESWRIQQARYLIRDPMVNYAEGQTVNVFSNLTIASEDRMTRAYVAAEEAVANTDLFASALEILLEKLHAAQRAVEEFQKFASRERPNEKERLARIGVALKALGTAEAAIRQ